MPPETTAAETTRDAKPRNPLQATDALVDDSFVESTNPAVDRLIEQIRRTMRQTDQPELKRALQKALEELEASTVVSVAGNKRQLPSQVWEGDTVD